MFENTSTFTIILCLIALLLVVIIATLITLLVYSGIFSSLDEIGTGKPPIGQTVIAYKFQKGPYNEAGQMFTEAAIISPGNKALGIYYDDPHKVDSTELRYVVGSILSEGSSEINETEVKNFTKEGFKILHLPEVTYAVKTKFPHLTSLSILIAIFKAYPCMREYIEEHKLCAYPFLEYYDGEHVHFMAPLSKQEEFFVPECENESVAGEHAVSTDFETTLNTSHSTIGGEHIGYDETSQDSTFDITQSSIAADDVSCAADDVLNEDDGGLSKAHKNNKSELADDEQNLSDGSTSSFEVVKNEF